VEITMNKTVGIIFPSMGRARIALLLLASIVFSSNAFGAEIRVFCTFGLQGAITQLGPQFERETGIKLKWVFT
jgi:ABC-type molybdate transport system substrate-binding protein